VIGFFASPPYFRGDGEIWPKFCQYFSLVLHDAVRNLGKWCAGVCVCVCVRVRVRVRARARACACVCVCALGAMSTEDTRNVLLKFLF